jgi:protein-S-isoprenylcysteine O-methyltransferase Ste14
MPFGLGSWMAVLPALLVVVAFVVRTALEDRTLQAELPGYAEYAAKVRYRLVPGVW